MLYPASRVSKLPQPPRWLQECPVCHRVFISAEPPELLPEHDPPGYRGVACAGSDFPGIVQRRAREEDDA
jgi:hypothetical protein